MKLSTRFRYGVRLMFQLAVNHGASPQQLSDIAMKEDISENYLGQIIISLKSAGLVNSVRGASGGYFLVRDPSEITVREIAEAIEGPLSLMECIANEDCPRGTYCAAKTVWSTLEEKISETLENFKLSDMVASYKKSRNVISYEI